MGSLFRAEPIWAGKSVVIVGGGESVTAAQCRLIAMARARNMVRVIALNDAVYPCWFADVAYACDRRWWEHHGSLPKFQGIKLGLEPTPFHDVHHMCNTGTSGFDPDPQALRSGGNSGYQALHLSAHLGAKRVILVGYDMKGRHWFGDHPPGVARAVSPNMGMRLREFSGLAPELAKRDITVVNATPGSALCHTVFPHVDLTKELPHAQNRIS